MKVRVKSICEIALYALIIMFMFHSGNIKYVFAAACSMLFLIIDIQKRKSIKKFIFIYEINLLLSTLVVFVVVSLIKQVINKSFNSYLFNEIIYFITPLFFVFLFIQLFDKNEIDRILFRLFLLLVVIFVIKSWGILSLKMIATISFSDSISPLEGTGLSFLFVPFIVYFYSQKKYLLQGISLILVFLTLKRLAFAFGCLICIVAFLDWKKKQDKRIVSKKIINIVMVCFILLPIITNFLLTDSFEEWFFTKTGLDIYSFTMGRFLRLNIVTDNNLGLLGWGSTTVYLSEYFRNVYKNTIHTNFNLHNDIYKVYLETGLLGTMSFTYTYFHIIKRNFYSFLLTVYLFFEMYVNHEMGAGTASIWIVYYLIVFSLNYQYSSKLGKDTSKEQ